MPSSPSGKPPCLSTPPTRGGDDETRKKQVQGKEPRMLFSWTTVAGSGGPAGSPSTLLRVGAHVSRRRPSCFEFVSTKAPLSLTMEIPRGSWGEIEVSPALRKPHGERLWNICFFPYRFSVVCCNGNYDLRLFFRLQHKYLPFRDGNLSGSINCTLVVHG